MVDRICTIAKLHKAPFTLLETALMENIFRLLQSGLAYSSDKQLKEANLREIINQERETLLEESSTYREVEVTVVLMTTFGGSFYRS